VTGVNNSGARSDTVENLSAASITLTNGAPVRLRRSRNGNVGIISDVAGEAPPPPQASAEKNKNIEVVRRVERALSGEKSADSTRAWSQKGFGNPYVSSLEAVRDSYRRRRSDFGETEERHMKEWWSGAPSAGETSIRFGREVRHN